MKRIQIAELPSITSLVLEHKPFSTNPQILYLGAGDGEEVKELARAGCEVAAVEESPKHAIKNANRIVWGTSKETDFVEKILKDPAFHFHVIILRNFHLFPPKWLDQGHIRLLGEKHLHSSGILAIRTFFQNPSPLIKGVHPYTLQELQKYFGPRFESVSENHHETKNETQSLFFLTWIARLKP